MRIFDKVAIVGTGLIGGSLGLAIKNNKLASKVVGVSRHKSSWLEARKKGAIDKGSETLNIINDADLLILATPVNTIISLAPKISKIINKNCIVMDVGSSKEEIVSRLSRVFPNYVGAHPLAGSEKRGIAFASSNLFNGSLCIITPDKNTRKSALFKIRKLWSGVGARTIEAAPSTHDKIMAFVSHLPHAASFALMNSVPKVFLRFAASGLKDTTRISASEPELWADIFMSNDKNILCALGLLEDNLKQIKFAIKTGNRNALVKILEKAKTKRKELK